MILWNGTATMQPGKGTVHLTCPLPPPRATKGGKVSHLAPNVGLSPQGRRQGHSSQERVNRIIHKSRTSEHSVDKDRRHSGADNYGLYPSARDVPVWLGASRGQADFRETRFTIDVDGESDQLGVMNQVRSCPSPAMSDPGEPDRRAVAQDLDFRDRQLNRSKLESNVVDFLNSLRANNRLAHVQSSGDQLFDDNVVPRGSIVSQHGDTEITNHGLGGVEEDMGRSDHPLPEEMSYGLSHRQAHDGEVSGHVPTMTQTHGSTPGADQRTSARKLKKPDSDSIDRGEIGGVLSSVAGLGNDQHTRLTGSGVRVHRRELPPTPAVARSRDGSSEPYHFHGVRDSLVTAAKYEAGKFTRRRSDGNEDTDSNRRNHLPHDNFEYRLSATGVYSRELSPSSEYHEGRGRILKETSLCGEAGEGSIRETKNVAEHRQSMRNYDTKLRQEAIDAAVKESEERLSIDRTAYASQPDVRRDGDRRNLSINGDRNVTSKDDRSSQRLQREHPLDCSHSRQSRSSYNQKPSGGDKTRSSIRTRRDDDEHSESDRSQHHQPGMKHVATGGDPPSSGDDSGGSEKDNRRKPDSEKKRTCRTPRTRERKQSKLRPASSSERSDSRSDSRRRKASRRRWMKPDKYDGRTSFESFIYMFENCSRYNRWNEEDKVAHLRWSLTGIAAQVLWDTDDLTYQQIEEKLRNRFGGKGMEERFQTELRCRRRSKGESIRELAQDIRRLMALAYPGEKSSLADHISRDAFLTALDDPEFELKVREREPPDLDTAVKMAQRFEVFKCTTENNAGSKHRVNRHVEYTTVEQKNGDELAVRIALLEQQVQSVVPERLSSATAHRSTGKKSSPQRRSTQVDTKSSRHTSTAGDSNPPWKNELINRIQELEATQAAVRSEASRIAAENDALSKEVGRLRHVEQLRAVPSTIEFRDSSGLAAPNTRRMQGACFSCGQDGHYARSCLNSSTRNGRAVRQQTQRQPAPVDMFQSSLRVAGSKRTGQRAAGRPAYLNVNIGSQKCEALLDSGSEVSLLPARFVDPQLITPTSQTLKAANGTLIAVLGQATLQIQFGQIVTSITGLVSEHVAEIMLGIDWLMDKQVVWDFYKGRIKFGRKFYPLHNKSSAGSWCKRVVLQEEVTIPARSEVNLPTKVVVRGRFGDGDDTQWGTDTNVIATGLHAARTLIPGDRFADVPVRVLNITSEPIKLAVGTTVADLQPMSVVGTMPMGEFEESTSATSSTTKPEEEPGFIEALIDQVHGSLPESAVVTLKQIITKYSDAFSQSENDLGSTQIVAHRIDTGSARPISQQLRRFPPAHVQAISEHVDSMLIQGIIEPAASPWSSNLVLVRKKDGSFRCCVDYRQLNSVTCKDAYPLPRIDTCLDAMATSKWFSTFDLRASYHQVMVDPRDMDKTTFICPRGMYRFRTMPFGLCNAGATFQRLMDIVMAGLHLDICLVYLDDIIIYSQSIEQHFERLVTILSRLRLAGLKLKPEKCALFQKAVSFLGHVISEDGISTDPAKIKVVVDWPTPTCQKDVRSFLGLANYYRRFVKNFAKTAATLNAALKRGGTFTWTAEMQESFDTLKSLLTSPPILAMPTDTGEFVLDTDASDFAIGAVLSQRQDGVERIVAYASRSLDKRERNYCVTRKELLAVVHFMKNFKQYLLGRNFKVRTDHAALIWLRNTPDPIGQQARWLEQMEEFNFVVEHRPGTKHGNADALSRRPCPRFDCRCRQHEREVNSITIRRQQDNNTSSINAGDACPQRAGDEAVDRTEEREQPTFGGPADTAQSAIKGCQEVIPLLNAENDHVAREHAAGEVISSNLLPWSWEGLRTAQKEDPDIGGIIQFLQESTQKPDWKTVALRSRDAKVLWQMWSRLSIRDGLLKRKFEEADGTSIRWQIVWPKKLREEFLAIAHGGMTGGHMGRKKTAAAVQSRAYWPSWSSDIDIFIKRCVPCARYHRGSTPKHGPMQIFPVGEPWETVSVDITGPHPRSSRGNQYILTLVDHFSKWAEAIAIPNHTAPVVARVLVNHVFSRFGSPRQLLTDRGPEFESNLFGELMKWFDIHKLRTTAYKPSTNGVVERFHRTLNAMLAKVINESQRDWDEHLQLVLAAYRASPHNSTGYSPNLLFLGRDTRMPLDLVMGLPAEERDPSFTTEDFIVDMQRRADFAYRVAREKLQLAAERRKVGYDINVKEQTFKEGDWVWYWNPRRYRAKSPKWQKCYTGPFLIVRSIPPVNFVLQQRARSKPFVTHADKLKRCYSDTPANWLTEAAVSERNDASEIPTVVAVPETHINAGPVAEHRDIPVYDTLEDSAFPPAADRNRRRNRRPPVRFDDFLCRGTQD
jgi:hypothetical protein